MKKIFGLPVFVLILTIAVGVIPFFWLKPGEMDLGGDGSRLFFYDPINYLRYSVLFVIQNVGAGIENPLTFFLPFNLMLVALQSILKSGYLVITLFNSFHLVIAFISMYFIAKDLIGSTKEKDILATEVAGVVVGVMYIFSPVLVRSAWDKAIITHAQFFLNPLMFYLLLKIFITEKFKYIFSFLLLTIIFSTNFSWAAAPLLFSFYPLSLSFIFVYCVFVLKKKISFRIVLTLLIWFLALHAFHYLPLIINIIQGSGLVADKIAQTGGVANPALEYFLESARHITLFPNLIGLPQLVPSIIWFEKIFIFTPFFLVIGLILSSKSDFSKVQKRTFVLIVFFYIISLFFATANVTHLWFRIYSSLFSIPGFSMFRNFYGHWAFVYVFFFSLVCGFGFYVILRNINNVRIQISLGILVALIFTVSALPFIRGDMVNLVLNKNQKIEFKVPIQMDPEYEKLLQFVREIPGEGKFITFPFTESFNQMLRGTQGGMYQGPSIISQLTGKYDYSGYQVLVPFSEVFLSLAKKQDFESLSSLLGLLNIRFIFHNSDPMIMDYFPDFPYQHVKKFLPNTQSEYETFIGKLPIEKRLKYGEYFKIYLLLEKYYLPTIYSPNTYELTTPDIDAWGQRHDAFFADRMQKADPRVVYLDNPYSQKLPSVLNTPLIAYQKINPTKYYVHVSNADGPYMLVLSQAYNQNWKIYKSSLEYSFQPIEQFFSGTISVGKEKNEWLSRNMFETWSVNPMPESIHGKVNGYANAWFISPELMSGIKEYTLIIELKSQRIQYVSLFIFTVVFVSLLCWGIRLLTGYWVKGRQIDTM